MPAGRIPPMILAALVLGGSAALPAQERATTESGKAVLLFPDGTWKPEQPDPGSQAKGAAFRRPAAAKAKKDFNHGTLSLYYNPKLWQERPTEDSQRTLFRHKDGDGYVLVLAERLEASLEALKKVAMMYATKAAPDAQVVHEERRTVNGAEVLYLQIEGTIQGIPFVYHGYYYGGAAGCVQVIGYTSRNLIKEYRADILDMLNGLTVN